jgi:uncharacterized protein
LFVQEVLMDRRWIRPLLGVAIAIAITATMDASGLSIFSALPLLPLMALFWWRERFSRQAMGFTWGRARGYGLALLHPALVLGLAALVAGVAGDIHTSGTNWQKAGINLVAVTLSTILVAIVTEEGFFRGWLWASLQRAGQDERAVLVWSSLAFAAWHVSAVVLPTGFNPPMAQVPVYLVNAALLGLIWGLLRLISGSLVAASVGHGVWNGLAYTFFGFGAEGGALGLQNTAVFGPEVGWVGLLLNLIFVAVLWAWYTRTRAQPRVLVPA